MLTKVLHTKSSIENFALLVGGGGDFVESVMNIGPRLILRGTSPLVLKSEKDRFLWTVVAMTCPRDWNPLTVARSS